MKFVFEGQNGEDRGSPVFENVRGRYLGIYLAGK